MTLEDLMRMLGEQGSNRNGVTSPSVYTPTSTSFQAYSDPNGLQGFVRPANPSVANINTEIDEGTRPAYVAFHEAAHTSQSLQDIILGVAGLGKYGPLSKSEFPEYDGRPVPPVHEALASLRGMEAMMPQGKTIWDLENMKDVGKNDSASSYRSSTMRNNPSLTKAGAQRLIDLRMFPEHQLMHDPGQERLTPFNQNPSLLTTLMNLFSK